MAPRKKEIYLVKKWMNAFTETKTTEEKEIYEDILGKGFSISKTRKKGRF